MDLTEVRSKIDAVDEQMIRLLNERADLVHEVGVIKKAAGQPIYAPEREEQVLRALTGKARDMNSRLPEKSIRAIYREVMSAALALEKSLTIAYFGPHSTNTHQAARSKFGASVDYSACTTIADVFDAVARGRADYGVVPIENSTEGAVNSTLDVFMESDLRICAQIHMKIENHLAAEIASTEPHAAALVGRMAAEVYGLQLLELSVQDNPNNTTRFLVIAPNAAPPTGDDRTALMFCVRDEAGALFRALEPFNRLRISMSKIESRPSKRKAWEYFFFVDVDGHADQSPLKEAIAELAEHCTLVKILGTYPKTGGQP